MLKFYAKSNLLVRVPGATPLPGQPDLYVGRTFDPATRGYPAVNQPYEVDENTDSGRRLIRLTTIDGSLYPADEYTASICGVPFVSVEFKDGVFVEKKKSTNKQTTEG